MFRATYNFLCRYLSSPSVNTSANSQQPHKDHKELPLEMLLAIVYQSDVYVQTRLSLACTFFQTGIAKNKDCQAKLLEMTEEAKKQLLNDCKKAFAAIETYKQAKLAGKTGQRRIDYYSLFQELDLEKMSIAIYTILTCEKGPRLREYIRNAVSPDSKLIDLQKKFRLLIQHAFKYKPNEIERLAMAILSLRITSKNFQAYYYACHTSDGGIWVMYSYIGAERQLHEEISSYFNSRQSSREDKQQINNKI